MAESESPVTPGEMLKEDFLAEYGLSQNRCAPRHGGLMRTRPTRRTRRLQPGNAGLDLPPDSSRCGLSWMWRRCSTLSLSRLK
jgi:hypothetical protein